MNKHGVVFDPGWRDTGVSYGGVAQYTLNVDTGKLGLWPGGSRRR